MELTIQDRPVFPAIVIHALIVLLALLCARSGLPV